MRLRLDTLMRRRRTLSVAAAAAAAAGLALAAPAWTGADPTLTTPDARVVGGETLVLQGRGFARNVHVTLLAGPTRAKAKRIGAARTGRRGSFVAEVLIEPGAAAKRYVAVACHDRCRSEATVRFRVVEP